MLYARYGSGARDILSMEFEVGMDVLFCAQRQYEEEMLYERWIHLLSDISFDDFKKQIGMTEERPQKEETEEDILNKVRQIMGG